MFESTYYRRNLLNKIGDCIDSWRGHPIDRDLAPYIKVLKKINAVNLESFSDENLKQKSKDLHRKTRDYGLTEKIITEAFTLIREIAYRRLGMRAFDVQILAALALSQNRLIEMPTGEGKTLIAVFPACLNALSGKKVHIFTANDYLARRDARWMAPVFQMLDLKVSYVQEGLSKTSRKKAYSADITYLTAKEAGFDYLRDHLCFREGDLVLPDLQVAIVDEADFILIDEARIPLVIAGESENPEIDLHKMGNIVRTLIGKRYYEIDQNRHNVYFTERGLERAESILKCGNLQMPGNKLKLTALNLALHAEVLLYRDVDYIVRNKKIELIDEFTGRVADQRRWPDGIQSAIESKEGLPIQKDGKILGSITLQHFLTLYPIICGMTATATPAAEEFHEIYGLKTVVIPPHKPCNRIDHPDYVFLSREEKIETLIEEIRRIHAQSRPILVGTASVKESENISRRLLKSGIKCQVLNAKNDEREANIISRAGALNAITISTNMAGRGTDIRLGGPDEKESKAVKKLGGLYVIGTNRHESLRIDLQLRGRAGRQGDPGCTRFFISAEDDLMRRYHLQSLFPDTNRSETPKDSASNLIVKRNIIRAQRIVESQNSEIRKTLFHYAQIIEEQRKTMASWRQNLLKGDVSSGYHKPVDRQPGKTKLERIERHIFLYHIDNHWSEHLARIADIREGIHLFRLAGQNPLDEYHKLAQLAFNQMREKLEQAINKTLKSWLARDPDKKFRIKDLTGPSSTWTYMLNDNPFSNLGIALIASRNIGFAVGAARSMILYAPLFLVMMLIKKVRKKAGFDPE